MTDEHEWPTRDDLARYDVPGAPVGFAARVAERIAAERGAIAAPRAWHGLAALAALAAVLALVVLHGPWIATGTGSGSGTVAASARESVQLAGRGVAVVEAGGRLVWTVATGDATIDQTAGAVFYRVEHGGPFTVHTPLGVVTVSGTCFSVEVTMLKRDVVSAAAGALLATAVVVTVYEGSVTLANPRGESIHLGPGEAGTLRPDEAPQSRGSTQLAATTTPVAPTTAPGELAIARARIASLESELRRRGLYADTADETPNRAKDPARYYAPSPETLREMAERCWIAYDQPGLDGEAKPVLVEEDLASEVGLTVAERDAVNQAYLKVNDRALDTLRRLYVELTGVDADVAAALSANALGQELQAKSTPEQELAARRRIARERAGLDPATAPAEVAKRPPIERYLRLMIGLGGEAETAAAAVVGAQRAHELRTHRGVGWHNTVSDYGGCVERHR